MTTRLRCIAAFSILSTLLSCSSGPPLSPWDTKPTEEIANEHLLNVMNSVFKVRLWKAGANGALQGKAFQAALSELRRVGKIADETDPKSEISRVNLQAYKGPVRVSKELFDLLTLGQKMWTLSEGVFDVTFLKIQEANEKNNVDAGLGAGIQDSAEDVSRQLKTTVGSKFLALDPVAMTVRFNKQGMKLGVLGLAKGYAVQKAAEKLLPFKLSGFAVFGGGILSAAGKALTDKNLMCLESPNELGTCAYTVIPKSKGSLFLMGASAVLERPGHIYNAKNGLRKARTGGVTIAGTDGAAIQAATTATGAMDNAKVQLFLDRKGDLPLNGVYYESDYSILLHGSLDPYAKTVLVTH
jgi:thiamine biosynthesis lipoprotein ApbE